MNTEEESEETEPDNLRSSSARAFSDDVSELCTLLCTICNKELLTNNFSSHVNAKHPGSRPNPTPVKVTHHRCKLCKEPLLFCPREITKHLNSKHSAIMLWSEYKKKYLTGPTSPEKLDKLGATGPVSQEGTESSQPIQKTLSGHVAKKIVIVKNGETLKETLSDVSEMRAENSQKVKITFKTNHVAEKPLKKVDAVKLKVAFSDDVADVCTSRCNYCNKEMTNASLNPHSWKYHDDAKPDYSLVKESFHRCKICGEILQFCSRIINLHLKKRHPNNKMTKWSEYKETYLKQSKSKEPVSNRKPGVKVKPVREAIVGEHKELAQPPRTFSKDKELAQPPRTFSEDKDIVQPPQMFSEDRDLVQPPLTFSDDLADVCRVQCNICSEEMLNSNFLLHSKNIHPGAKADCRFTKKTFHSCKMCSSTFLFCQSILGEHLRTEHSEIISKRLEYEEMFLTDSGTTAEEPDLVQTGCDPDPKSECIKLSYLEVVSNSDVKRESDPILQTEFDPIETDSKLDFEIESDPIKNVSKFDLQTEFDPIETDSKLDLKIESDSIKTVSNFDVKIKSDPIDTVKKCEDSNSDQDSYNSTLVFSDDLADVCRFRCNTCNKEDMGENAFFSHAHRNHPGLKPDKTITKTTYHRCKYCNESLQFSYHSITNHLKSKHFGVMTNWSEYSEKFLSNTQIMLPKSPKKLRSPNKMGNPTMRIISKQNSSPHKIRGPIKEDDEDARVFSDDISDICTVRCSTCQKVMLINLFSSHVRKNHPSTISHFTFVKEVFHRCKICSQAVLFCPRKVSCHLTYHHSSIMTKWKEYKNRYLSALERTDATLNSIGNYDTPKKLELHSGNVTESITPIKPSIKKKDASCEQRDGPSPTDVVNRASNLDFHAESHTAIHGDNSGSEHNNLFDTGESIFPSSSVNSEKINHKVASRSTKEKSSELKDLESSLTEIDALSVNVKCKERDADLLKVDLKASIEELPDPELPQSSEQSPADRVFSDDIADVCQVRCNICSYEIKLSNYNMHARVKHSGLTCDYTFVKETFHRCKICSTALHFSSSTITNHVRSNHFDKLKTWSEYRERYLTNPKTNNAKDGLNNAEILVSPVKSSNNVENLSSELKKIKVQIKEAETDIHNLSFIKDEPCSDDQSFDREISFSHESKLLLNDERNFQETSLTETSAEIIPNTIKCPHCDIVGLKAQIESHIKLQHSGGDVKLQHSGGGVKLQHSGVGVKRKRQASNETDPDTSSEEESKSEYEYRPSKSKVARTMNKIDIEKKYYKLSASLEHSTSCDESGIAESTNVKKPSPSKSNTTPKIEKEIAVKLEDMATGTCSSCGKEGYVFELRRHIYNKRHIQECLAAKIKYTRRTYHQCSMCPIAILFAPYSVKEHIRTNHRSVIKPNAYWDKHYGGLPLPAMFYKPTRITEDLDTSIELLDEHDSFSFGSILEVVDQKNPGKAQNEEDKTSRHSDQEKKFTDDLNEVCMSKCTLCGKNVLSSKHVMHMNQEHKDIELKFMAFDEHRNTYHRCKLCAFEMKFRVRILSSHLKSHNVSFKQYKKKYLKQNQKEQDVPDDPNKEYTDNLKKLCTSKCNLCGKIVSSSNHIFHMNQDHKEVAVKDLSLYTPHTNTYHRCKLCGEDVLGVNRILARHLRGHNMSLAQYKKDHIEEPRVYSDNLREVCTSKCNMCGKSVLSSRHVRHMHQEHKDVELGAMSFQPLVDTYHKCKLCGEEVLFRVAVLSRHVQTVHKTTFSKYKIDHLVFGPTEKGDKSRYRTLVQVDDSEKELSDDLRNVCKSKCSLCDKIILSSSHCIHMKVDHKDVDFSLRYFQPYSNTYHRCKICEKVLLFRVMVLSRHLGDVHKTTFKAYKIDHLLYNPRPTESEEINFAVDEPKKFSDDLRNVCESKCRLCEKIVSSSRQVTHISSEHQDVEYNRKMFQPCSNMFHRCKICDKEILFRVRVLSKHLGIEHKTTFKQYKADHLANDIAYGNAPKQFSDNLGEVCKSTCNLCEKVVSSSKHGAHMRHQHKGEDTSERTFRTQTRTFHRCKVCQKELRFSVMVLSKHLAIEHKSIKFEQYKKEYLISPKVTPSDCDDEDPKEVGPAADLLYSDDPEEMCRVVCSICNLEMFRHKFNFHKRSHKEAEGKEGSYQWSKKTHTKCKLCQRTILFCDNSIRSHIRSTHHDVITLPEYKNKYINVQRGTTIILSPPSPPRSLQLLKEEYSSPSEDEEEDYDVLAGSEDEFQTNDVHKMCLCRCLFCLQVFTMNQIRHHIYKKHGESANNIDETKYIIVRKTYHKCRICSKSLMFSLDTIFTHVRTHHYINIFQYKTKYLGYDKDSYVFRKRSYAEAFANNSKVQLLTGRLKLENSIKLEVKEEVDTESDAMTIEATNASQIRAKMEVAEAPKHEEIDNETPPSSVQDEVPSVLKTVVSGLADNIGLPDDSNETPPSSVQEVPSVLKTVVSGLADNIGLPDDSRDKDPLTLIDVSKVKQGCVEEKPEFVFKCPFSQCKAFTIKEGLKDGRAASHCWNQHLTRPNQLRKLNLRWLRVPSDVVWDKSDNQF